MLVKSYFTRNVLVVHVGDVWRSAVSGNRPLNRRYMTPFGQKSSFMKVDRWSVGTLTTNELKFTLWRDSNRSTLRVYLALILIYSTISSDFVE